MEKVKLGKCESQYRVVDLSYCGQLGLIPPGDTRRGPVKMHPRELYLKGKITYYLSKALTPIDQG